MKKIAINKTHYDALVKIVHENGSHTWIREKCINLAEAKRIYISFSNSIGADIHTWSGGKVFYGHTKGATNGKCGGCFIEEIKPIMFQ